MGEEKKEIESEKSIEDQSERWVLLDDLCIGAMALVP